MKLKRILACLLIPALLLPVLASCGESAENSDPAAGTPAVQGASDPAAAAPEEEAPAEDPDARLYADLPAADYAGRTFVILSPRHTEYDWVGEVDGDVISEAVYKRNLEWRRT